MERRRPALTHELDEFPSSEPRRMHRGGLPDQRLRRVLEYISRHFEEEITLRDLAAVAGLSIYHFAKAFRVSAGLPPYRYVLEARIKHAAQLLQDTDEPIAQIALATGFSDHSQFARQFRRMVGITPTRYRSSRREGR